MPSLRPCVLLNLPILLVTTFTAAPVAAGPSIPASGTSDPYYELFLGYVRDTLQVHSGGVLPECWPPDTDLHASLGLGLESHPALQGQSWCAAGILSYVPCDQLGVVTDADFMGFSGDCLSYYPPSEAYWLVEAQTDGQLAPGDARRFVVFYPTSPGIGGGVYAFPISQPGLLEQPDRFCVVTPNSTGSPARIEVQGSTSVSANDLVLRAGPVPDTGGLFFLGTQEVLLPFGDGFRCVGGALRRLPIEQASQGWLVHAVDFTDSSPPASQITWGSTWLVQAWYRDPAAGGAGFNSSDALRLTFCL